MLEGKKFKSHYIDPKSRYRVGEMKFRAMMLAFLACSLCAATSYAFDEAIEKEINDISQPTECAAIVIDKITNQQELEFSHILEQKKQSKKVDVDSWSDEKELSFFFYGLKTFLDAQDLSASIAYLTMGANHQLQTNDLEMAHCMVSSVVDMCSRVSDLSHHAPNNRKVSVAYEYCDLFSIWTYSILAELHAVDGNVDKAEEYASLALDFIGEPAPDRRYEKIRAIVLSRKEKIDQLLAK